MKILKKVLCNIIFLFFFCSSTHVSAHAIPSTTQQSSSWTHWVTSTFNQCTKTISDGFLFITHSLGLTSPHDPKSLKQIAEVQGYGYKTANLFELEQIIKHFRQGNEQAKFKIPEFIGITSQEIKTLFNDLGLDLSTTWHDIIKTHCNEQTQQQALREKKLPQPFLDALKKLTLKITSLAIKPLLTTPPKLAAFIEQSSHKNWRLMVRSSGKEDTQELANAGGNHTEINVPPTRQPLLKAIVTVIASYLSEKSLQQRLQAGDTTIFNEPLTPVLIQRMIGEQQDSSDIPVGCVVYSQEIEANTAGVTIIQASFGHNEGVVESSIPVDTYYVGPKNNFHQIISIKDKRLVPVNHAGQTNKYGLELQANPASHTHQPALSKKVACMIKQFTNSIQNHYGQPMDLELVYQPDTSTIYLVQARPIVVAKNRAWPSYIFSLDGCTQKDLLPCTTVSSAGGSVKHVTNSQQLITASTLDNALTAYNTKTKAQSRNKIAAIIVEQEAEPTSHAAAIFRGEGKMILRCKNMNQLSSWLSKKDINLAIDPQREVIINYEKLPLNVPNNIKKGWLNHPLPLVISIPSTSLKPSLVNDIDHYQGYSFKTLIEKVKEEYAQEASRALNAIKTKIQQQIAILRRQENMHAHTIGQQTAAKTATKLTAIFTYINQISKEIESTLRLPARDIQRLYTIRFLEAALFQPASPEVVNAYSFESVMNDYTHEITFLEQTLQPLIQEEKISKKFARNEKMVTHAHQGADNAVTDDVQNAWITFLDLFTASASPQEINNFDTMMSNITTLKLFPEWLNTSFYTTYQSLDDKDMARQALTCFHVLHNEFQAQSKILITLKEQKHYLLGMATMQWESPADFDQQYTLLDKQILSFIASDEFSTLLAQCKTSDNVLLKLAVTSMLQQTVETLDNIIKSVKGSTHYTTTQQKIQHVKKLLNAYFALLQKLDISFHIANALERILLCASETDADELISSPRFNVSNFIHLEKVLHEEKRKLTKTSLKKTINLITSLEDAFTTIHQLLLYKIGRLIITWDLQDLIEVPAMIEKVQDQLQLDETLTGIMFSKNNVIYFYNEKLRAHSLTIALNYDIKNKACDMNVRFYGNNEYGRWSIIKDYVTIVSQVSHLTLKQVNETDTGLSFTWTLPPQTDLTYIDNILEDTIETTFKLALENSSTIYKKTKKMLSHLLENLINDSGKKAEIIALLTDQLITNNQFNLLLIPALKHISIDDKNLVTLLKKVHVKSEELFAAPHKQDTIALGFFSLEELFKKLYELKKDDEEIHRLAQTDFDTLAHSKLELQDNDDDEDVIALLLDEAKGGLAKIAS